MFTRVLDGEGDYALDSVIQRSDFNLFFSINSEIYAYVWFPSCFGAALSLAGGCGAPWVVWGKRFSARSVSLFSGWHRWWASLC